MATTNVLRLHEQVATRDDTTIIMAIARYTREVASHDKDCDDDTTIATLLSLATRHHEGEEERRRRGRMQERGNTVNEARVRTRADGAR